MLPRFTRDLAFTAIALFAAVTIAQAAEGTKQRLYFGTYTQGSSEGIYTAELDLSTGDVSECRLVAKVTNPSFVAIHPSKKYLYAVGEIDNFEGKSQGGVYAYEISPETGDLKLLGSQSSVGAGPCHVSIHPSGSHVFAANYGGGSVCALPILQDGNIGPATGFVQHMGTGPDASRQKGPHAHSINPDQKGNYIFAADLGLDKVLIYKLDSTGKLVPNNPAAGTVPPGSGPRHFAFHPSGKYAYVINEMTMTITAYAYDAEKGSLEAIETVSTLPAGAEGKNFSTAEVQAHPSGKFVYGSNRGHNSISVFNVDETTGKLAFASNTQEGIDTPRNFGIDPTGKFAIVCNQGGKSAFVYKIDQKTGALTRTGKAIAIDSPVCVKFLAIE